jgi:hypothetical protein
MHGPQNIKFVPLYAVHSTLYILRSLDGRLSLVDIQSVRRFYASTIGSHSTQNCPMNLGPVRERYRGVVSRN